MPICAERGVPSVRSPQMDSVAASLPLPETKRQRMGQSDSPYPMRHTPGKAHRAMYADFPPLITTDADPSILPTAGYEYEFWENGRLHTNRYPYGVNGSPQGVLQPSFVGEEVFDTLNKVYYRATGLTKDDWVALN